MSSDLRRAIRDEVHLVERFTQSYRAQLGELIGRMNRGQPASGGSIFNRCAGAWRLSI